MRIYLSTVLSVLALSGGMAYADSSETNEIASWGAPVSESQLDLERGGTDFGPQLIINRNDLKANMHDNHAYDNVTGDNAITGNAFAGASGIPIVMQNTGNNVIMQNAVIVNLMMQ